MFLMNPSEYHFETKLYNFIFPLHLMSLRIGLGTHLGNVLGVGILDQHLKRKKKHLYSEGRRLSE